MRPDPHPLRGALRWLAVAYLTGVWLDGAGSTLPGQVLPRVANYFLQVSALFPYSATASIDYRAEAWVCSDRTWQELDTRPYFPLDPDDKENRFQRVMHFFRENEPTMRALDEYLVTGHGVGRGPDGIAQDRAIGGVRLCSLRIPIPKPGDPIEPVRHRPLSDYPHEERHYFYHTPKSIVAERCRSRGGE
jgi:hypothetical protein